MALTFGAIRETKETKETKEMVRPNNSECVSICNHTNAYNKKVELFNIC